MAWSFSRPVPTNYFCEADSKGPMSMEMLCLVRGLINARALLIHIVAAIVPSTTCRQSCVLRCYSLKPRPAAFVQVVSPPRHHFATFGKPLRRVIDPAHTAIEMRKLKFYPVSIELSLIENRRCRRSEAVNRGSPVVTANGRWWCSQSPPNPSPVSSGQIQGKISEIQEKLAPVPQKHQ